VKKKINKMCFTNIQSVINGCLLGDGCLYMHKNCKNACFNYLSSSKQHVEFVHKYFKEYCTDNYKEIKRSEIYDKRTNKTYVNYHFRTKCLPFFTEYYYQYYIDNIKIVPKNIIIDNTVLLFWYIGDGQLDAKNMYIKLHTNAFTKDDVLFLCNSLNKYSANIMKKQKEEYLVRIPRLLVKDFLKDIGECPIKDYSHKWDYIPIKNKNIELNGIKHYEKHYDNIKHDFMNNNISIYKLSIKYNVHIKCIKNYFNNNNIFWKPVDNKKRIVQYDLDDNMIREWESGHLINIELGYNQSSISECCRGIKNKYKNYKWKFK
jgi:hypothetical protein